MIMRPAIPILGLLFANLSQAVPGLLAQEFERFRLDPLVKEVIMQNEALQEGSIRLARINERLCLLSTDYSEADGSGFTAMKKAERAAQLSARVKMVEFINAGKYSASDFVETKALTKNDVTKVREFFSSTTKREVEGLIRGVREVGTWRVKGEPVVFAALLLKLEGAFAGAVTRAESAPSAGAVSAGESSGLGQAANGVKIIVLEARVAFLGNRDSSRQKAKVQAMDDAITTGLGEFVEAESLKQNEKLLEKVLSQRQGVVSEFVVIDESVVGDEFIMKARVSVSLNKLKDQTAQVGLLRQKLGNPKVAIVAIELDDGEIYRSDTAPLLTMLNGQFAERGVRPTDIRQRMLIRKTQEPEKWKEFEELIQKAGDSSEAELDITKFGRLGFDADYIVVGRVNSTPQGKGSDGLLDKYNCRIVLKLLNAGNGDILATKVENKTAVGDNLDDAVVNVCKKLLPQAGELIDGMLKQWQDMANNGRRIILAIENLPSGRVGRDMLRRLGEIPRVKLAERTVKVGSRAEFNLMVQGTPSDFISSLELWLDDAYGEWMDEEGYDFDCDQRAGSSIVLTWKKE